jgi:Undecaprenyl-phosphate galactose phosphotransferase WbaP
MGEITIGLSKGKRNASTSLKIIFQTHHRARMFAITFLSDLMALILSATFVHVSMYRTFQFDLISLGEIEHCLFMIICFSLFMTTRLYPGIGLNPALEMKTVTHLNIVSFLIVFGFLMIRIPLWTQEKWELILISGLSIPSILGVRWLIRILVVQMGIWGEPVVVVASHDKVENLIGYFHERHRLGFVPVLGITLDSQSPSTTQIMEVKELIELPDNHFARKGIHTVLVNTQIVSDLSKLRINQLLLRKFERMIFVSDMDWLEGASITCHDFEGMLGLEARQNFLTMPDEIFKRLLDILISILFGIIFLPLLVLTALMIKLDSPGPVFFKQQRLGKAGRRITIFKFRSMQVNAEKVLTEYLGKNPSALEEWNQTQKLHDDPRITRVGRWIREFSIDELPQLYNILKGDMSMVGPRPIMLDQNKLYGEGLDVYTSVRPGLTGFWQVSGRNRTSFCQRAAYDVYYVRNWSIWLDIYILLRTVWVVLIRDGAY